MENPENDSNSVQLIQPKVTGKVMFQFDDDEPQILANLLNYEEFNITLKQPKPGSFRFRPEGYNVYFTSPKGKRFKIFISDDVEQR